MLDPVLVYCSKHSNKRRVSHKVLKIITQNFHIVFFLARLHFFCSSEINCALSLVFINCHWSLKSIVCCSCNAGMCLFCEKASGFIDAGFSDVEPYKFLLINLLLSTKKAPGSLQKKKKLHKYKSDFSRQCFGLLNQAQTLILWL